MGPPDKSKTGPDLNCRLILRLATPVSLVTLSVKEKFWLSSTSTDEHRQCIADMSWNGSRFGLLLQAFAISTFSTTLISIYQHSPTNGDSRTNYNAPILQHP